MLLKRESSFDALAIPLRSVISKTSAERSVSDYFSLIHPFVEIFISQEEVSISLENGIVQRIFKALVDMSPSGKDLIRDSWKILRDLIPSRPVRKMIENDNDSNEVAVAKRFLIKCHLLLYITMFFRQGYCLDRSMPSFTNVFSKSGETLNIEKSSSNFSNWDESDVSWGAVIISNAISLARIWKLNESTKVEDIILLRTLRIFDDW